MEAIQFDWSSAEVQDGRLTVSLDGKPSKAWKQSFETAARLLNNGRFGDLSLKRSAVRIEPVVPGEEDAARHFLEGLAQEANAHVQADEPEPEPDGEADEDDASDEDGAMTKRFRAFASADDDTKASGGS